MDPELAGDRRLYRQQSSGVGEQITKMSANEGVSSHSRRL